MKIKILPKEQAIVYKPNDNEKTSIIRINEPYTNPISLKYSSQFKRSLELAFHDAIAFTKNLPSNIRLFDYNDAYKVIEFFNEVRNDDLLIIHCHAGVSRSPAIALSFAWFLNDCELESEILKSKKYIPNYTVLSVLADCLGIKGKKQEIIELFNPKNFDDDDDDDDDFEW